MDPQPFIVHAVRTYDHRLRQVRGQRVINWPSPAKTIDLGRSRRDIRRDLPSTVVFKRLGDELARYGRHGRDVLSSGGGGRWRHQRRQPAYAVGDRWLDIHSGSVTHYLREAAGMSASTKEFRTWNATILGASTLACAEPPTSRRGTERLFKTAVSSVAEHLANTVAIARRPCVFNRYRAGWSIRPEAAPLRIAPERHPPTARRPVETAALDLIQQRWDSPQLGWSRVETGTIWGVALSADGRLLASAGTDGTGRVPLLLPYRPEPAGDVEDEGALLAHDAGARVTSETGRLRK